MLLPPLLFAELAPHFDHHNTWHVARRKGQQVLRAKLHGECGPVLAGIDEPGSGCDFLKFHRRMMRHFMFVLERVKDRNFRFDRWPTNRLPNWVERALIARFPAHDLSRSYSQIDELVAAGRIDDLGGFIEANDLWRPQPGASLHNRLHTALAAHECAMYCGDETSPMNEIGRSPGNILFWTLHDWIDRHYEECQRNAREVPDLSPVPMHLHDSVTTELRADLPV